MPFVGHLKVKFRIGRSHYNAALVQIRLDDNFYTPGGEPVRVRVRIPIDDNFDTGGGTSSSSIRIRIDDSDFGVRLFLFVHWVDF